MSLSPFLADDTIRIALAGVQPRANRPSLYRSATSLRVDYGLADDPEDPRIANRCRSNSAAFAPRAWRGAGRSSTSAPPLACVLGRILMVARLMSHRTRERALTSALSSVSRRGDQRIRKLMAWLTLP